MGQRLVITIKDKDRELAAIYYHWSAYTYSALCRTEDVIKCLYNHNDETDDQMLLRLIKHIEETGGGIRCDEGLEEHKYIRAKYPNETFKEDDYSRNNGLIALSEKGIAGLQYWSEGDVDIDISSDTVTFCVYSGYEYLEEYIEERKSWDEDLDEEELKEIPKYDFSLGSFDVNEIYEIVSLLEDESAHVIQCDGEICEMIE